MRATTYRDALNYISNPGKTALITDKSASISHLSTYKFLELKPLNI